MSSKSFSLKAIISAVDRVSGPMKRANRVLRKYRKSLLDVGRAGKRMGAALSNALGPAARLLGAGGLAGMFMGLKKVVGVSADFERIETTLRALSGSSEVAKKQMAWIEGFAEKTPYQLNEVADAFVQLQANGLDASKGVLKAAGDAAAMLSIPIESAVDALAATMRGENDPIEKWGINVKTKGEKVEYSWMEHGKRMTRIADKNNREMIAAIVSEIWERKAGGMMDELSKTWNGMWSNMQDTITRVWKTIGESGLFDFLKNELKGLLETVKSMEKDGSLKKWAQEISAHVVCALKELKTTVMEINWKEVWGGIKDLGHQLKSLGKMLGGVKGVFWAFVAVMAGPLVMAATNLVWSIAMLATAFGGPLIGGIAKLITWGGKLWSVITLVGSAIWTELGARFVAALRVLGAAIMAHPIIAAIAAIATAAYLIYKNWEPIKGFFVDLWADVKDAFGWAIAFAQPYIATMGSWVADLISAWQPIKGFFVDLWAGVKDAFNSALEYIQPLIDKIAAGVGKVSAVWSGVKGWFGSDAPNVQYKTVPGAQGTPAALGRSNLLGTAAVNGRTDLHGAINVKFENAPPGMRVEPGNTNQAGVALNPDVGYRSAVAGAW